LTGVGTVGIEKRFVRKKPSVNGAVTTEGRRRIAAHWEQLERLKHLSRSVGLPAANDRERQRELLALAD
jgi:hypothetical protein